MNAQSVRSRTALLLPVIALFGFQLGMDARAQDDLRVWRGLLHAHTYFSDGSGTPEEAFARARTKGIHFFAVTPHNHAAAEMGAKERADGILIANNHALYNSQGNVTFNRKGHTESEKSVMQAAQDASVSGFVALYGQEFSTISSGNHVNVLGAPEVLEFESGDFRALFDYLRELRSGGGSSLVVQLNHPNVHEDLFYRGSSESTRKKMQNDYGFDDYEKDFAQLVEAADPFVRLIEIFSGPAMHKSRAAQFRYQPSNNDYFYYLSQGFHVSPSAGHDNHYRTWGDATDARMGIWAASLSEANVLSAFRDNRTFVSEDKDLSLQFRINGEVMGSVLELTADTVLAVQVEISDPSDPQQGYEVTLVHGTVSPQSETNLQKLVEADGEVESLTLSAAGSAEFGGYVATGEPEFYYVHVQADDGDRAWSAPVWINHPRADTATGSASPTTGQPPMFAWTKSAGSSVYHYAWCKWVRRIHPENLVEGNSPPPGRQLHDCERNEEIPEH